MCLPESLHSKMSLLPSSSCLSWGFRTKAGAAVSPTEPMLVGGVHAEVPFHAARGLRVTRVVGEWKITAGSWGVL